MRPRVPEAMVMGDAEAVEAFDRVDPILQLPIYRLNAEAISALLPENGLLFDLGSGSGRLLAQLADGRPDARILGVDLAEAMVATGREALARAGLGGRVELRVADMTDPVGAAPEHVDVVSCVWALHHLPTPADAARCLRGIAALRERTGCAVWLFDFARLADPAAFAEVLALSPVASPQLVADGRASEAAAWSAEELRGLLEESGLGDLAGGAERRIGHLQAYFSPARANGRGRWSGAALSEPSASVLTRLRDGLDLP